MKRIAYRTTGADRRQGSFVDEGKLIISADGTTTLTVFAEDNAGNVEASRTIELKIDKIAPTITSAGQNRATHSTNA